MINRKFLTIVVCFAVGCTVAFAETETKNEDLAAAIEHLLSFVEKSDCTFIRNNKSHTAQEAVTHIKRKYEHFRDEIKTPEDFIRLSATKSLMTGKPYMVKTKAGKLIKSEVWLLEALEAYRQKKPGEPDGGSQ